MNLKAILLGLIGLLFGAAGVGTIDSVYADISALVIAVTLFSEWLLSVVTVKKFLAQLITWGTGIVFVFAGWLLNLGFLVATPAGDEYKWWEIVILGVGVSLLANGLWPTVVKPILEKLKLTNSAG